MSDAILADDLRGDLGKRRERSPRPEALRPEALRARLVGDSWTRRDALRLRHLCYHAEGYIDARPNEEFSDTYDFGGRSRTIVVYEGAEPIGSVRICTARRSLGEALPLADTFPDEFAAAFAGHELAVEFNRLVCHPDHVQNQAVVLGLIRVADFLVRRLDPGFISICVRANHMGFWKRLRFETIAGPRTYAGLKFPTHFLLVPREKYAFVRKVVPFLHFGDAASAAYENLFHNETVRIFGHDA